MASFSSRIDIPPVTKNLLVINIMLWLGEFIFPGFAERTLLPRLGLHYIGSDLFNPAQLFTYMFLHGGFTHLFFNMFALVMFGMTIERAMGSGRFLFYYISVGIGAAFIQMGVFALYINHLQGMFDPEETRQIIERGWELMQTGYGFADPDAQELNSFVNTPMVGASGAIYGVLLAFGFLFPNVPIYIFFFPVPVKAKWLIIGYFVLELLYGISGTADGVAHFAHIGGMVFGFLLLLYWKRRGVFDNRWFL